MERELITIAEAGRRWFGVSHNTAKLLADDGTIPTVKIGKQRRVDVAVMRARFSESPDARLAKIVRENIAVIESALLLLANKPNVEEHTDMPPANIARLADTLRETVECAS